MRVPCARVYVCACACVRVCVCVSPGTQQAEKGHSVKSAFFLRGCQLQFPPPSLGGESERNEVGAAISLFCGFAHGRHKFPDQGRNPRHRRNQSQRSDSVSSTRRAARELPLRLKSLKAESTLCVLLRV